MSVVHRLPGPSSSRTTTSLRPPHRPNPEQSTEPVIAGDPELEPKHSTLPIDDRPDPSRTDMTPGSVLDHYRVLGYLASGGMGIIYLGEDLRSGDLVALKVPQERLVGDASAIQRFIAEATAGARVSHPGVARLLGHGWFGGGAYLAMEYLPGENLQTHLQRERRMPLSRAIDIAMQVGEALDGIHRAGVIHCDLKPANVQLVPAPRGAGRPTVKILDFGVAELSGEGPRPRARGTDLIGTPHYMAPEQIDVGAAIDHRCDIYSFGCILYQLTTGFLPFQGSTFQILAGHRVAPPPRPLSINRDVPPAIEALILGMMAKEPERRPSDVLEVVRVLALAQVDRELDA